MPKIENPPEPGIRPARIREAPELSDLCVRSKAMWGYDETFMFLARPALAVSPEQIAAGDVWIATDAQGSIAGLVALGLGDQPHALDLDKLFVEPRRIRAGVGRGLLSHAIAEARRRGARRLTILSDPFAAGFYQRNGATRIGEAPSDAVPGRMLPLFEIDLEPARQRLFSRAAGRPYAKILSHSRGTGMDREQVIGALRAHEAELHRFGVAHIYLFGSVAREQARPDSDVDLFFDTDDPRFSLIELVDLQELVNAILGVDADVMTRASLHPMLRTRIEAEALRIF